MFWGKVPCAKCILGLRVPSAQCVPSAPPVAAWPPANTLWSRWTHTHGPPGWESSGRRRPRMTLEPPPRPAGTTMPVFDHLPVSVVGDETGPRVAWILDGTRHRRIQATFPAGTLLHPGPVSDQ